MEHSRATLLTAADAEEHARVHIWPLATIDECVAGAGLLAEIWGTAPESAPLQSDVLVCIGHAGGCVLGAFDGGRLIGLTVGIAGAPHSSELYSLIAGVSGSAAGRGVGAALKLAQRDWAVARGATRMKWTFDPLIRRNAHFNLNRLGARVEEFIADFYPPMHDALNAADLPDRLVAVWEFANPALPVTAPPATAVLACDDAQQPVRHPGADGPWLAALPPDIEEIRRGDPELALRWRLALREVLGDAHDSGRRIVGLTPAGSYLLDEDIR